MGKRGPAPKPTNLRILHGDRKDRINTREPQAPDKPPTMPAWLPEEGKRLWRRLAPQLAARKVLTDWDRETFTALCVSWALYREAVGEVRKRGRGVALRDRDGRIRKNPIMQIVRDMGAQFRAFAQEFGLTPSSRSMIQLAGEDADELERLLS